MNTSVPTSFSNIDIDLVTLPETEAINDDDNDNDNENDNECKTEIEPLKPNKLSTKWDWNADFIPLHGSFYKMRNSLHPHSESEESDQGTPPKSALKNKTQMYRDESKGIPPWISNTYRHNNFLDRLHSELVDFCMYVSPTKQEHSIRTKLIDRIKQIVLNLWPNAEIHVFGSMKTKLYLPASDIDLTVYPNTNNSNNIDFKLQLAQSLKKENMCCYLEIISTARVPLVKFTDSNSKISVDVCFDRESGVIAADEINSLQSKYPVLRPLTYFLKYFLWFRNLNEPFRGGMGSYLLQMLIVNLIQSHPIRAINKRWKYVDSEISLGGWLMAFFELYGVNFNYSELGISPYPNAHYFIKEEHGLKIYDRPYLLCCECPFESTQSNIMDSGRNTYNMMKIKLAFEWAYNQLLANRNNNNNKRKSILGLLVGIRGQMLQMRSKDNNNKLVKFPTNNDNHINNDINDGLFIPLNRCNSPYLSSSSIDSTSSSYTTSSCSSSPSSSYSSYYQSQNNGDIDSDIDSDQLPYYEASEFQQKHLFNTNLPKTPPRNNGNNVLMNNNDDDQDDDLCNNVTFSFEKKLDIEHNPYLNKKYDPFRNKKNKRRLSGINNNKTTPPLKRRKTVSNISSVGTSRTSKSENDNKVSKYSLVHSFSMPDLRKSTPCIFYKKGSCKKGKLCPFQHGDDDGKRIQDKDLLIDNEICWNFTSGHCHRGNKCRWLHSVPKIANT